MRTDTLWINNSVHAQRSWPIASSAIIKIWHSEVAIARKGQRGRFVESNSKHRFRRELQEIYSSDQIVPGVFSLLGLKVLISLSPLLEWV